MENNYEMNYPTSGVYSTTEMRRRYPKDHDGAKDEWKAMIKHQTEVNEMIIRKERELKQLNQDQLGRAYDHRLQELIRAKENELRQKQDEARMIAERAEQFQRDMMKQKEDKNMLQNYLADEYSSNINYKHLTEQQKRDQKIGEEKAMIEETKRRMEEARRRELMKQEEYYQTFNDEIRRAEEKNQRTLENRIQDKLDYRDQIRENERKQILKEENYKNFFKLSMDNQKKLMDIHAQNVLAPKLEKDQQFETIVDKRVNDERQRQLADEINRKQWREERNYDVATINRGKMDEHEYRKQMERLDKQIKVQESLRQSMEYQDFLRQTKDIKMEQQRQYKEFLDRQAENRAERDLLNKMTKDEKKINFGDLQSWKGYDSKMFALVPGFINSKYTNPLGGKEYNKPSYNSKHQMPTYSDRVGELDSSLQQNTDPGLRYETMPNDSSIQNYQTAQSPISNPGSPSIDKQYLSQDPYIRGDEVKVNSSLIAANSPQMAAGKAYSKGNQGYIPMDVTDNRRTWNDTIGSTRGPHNPLTNPLPVNNQNPYISRELQKIGTTRRPYFANMASNNLIA